MKSVIEKLKPILLLLSMSLVSLGIVWVVNQFKSVNTPVYSQVPEANYVYSQTLDTSSVEDSSVPEVITEESLTLNTLGGQVLGDQIDAEYQCKGSDFTDIRSESICKRTYSGQIGFTDGPNGLGIPAGGVTVRADANVVLTEVTVPLELLSGVEVADSNRLIKTDTPTLKPAGEQVDDLSANVMLPPNTQIDSHRPWEEEKPFKTEYSVGFPEGTSEEGKIGVETKIENECEECKNKSNVNPDKSNKISEFMLDSTDRYPGETAEVVPEEIIENCSDRDTFVPWEKKKYTACKLDAADQIIEFFKNIPGWGTLIGNLLFCAFNPDECMKTTDIIVIMASPFGSDIDCTEGGACTNAYMNSRNSNVTAPNTDLGGKHYYLTPCKALVQGAFDVQDVKCAWDMSHLFKELKVNEYDDGPSVDTTPTKGEYENFLNETIQGNRPEAVPI